MLQYLAEFVENVLVTLWGFVENREGEGDSLKMPWHLNSNWLYRKHTLNQLIGKKNSNGEKELNW